MKKCAHTIMHLGKDHIRVTYVYLLASLGAQQNFQFGALFVLSSKQLKIRFQSKVIEMISPFY